MSIIRLWFVFISFILFSVKNMHTPIVAIGSRQKKNTCRANILVSWPTTNSDWWVDRNNNTTSKRISLILLICVWNCSYVCYLKSATLLVLLLLLFIVVTALAGFCFVTVLLISLICFVNVPLFLKTLVLTFRYF